MLTIQSFVFNPFSENTYILHNENNNAYIIDPGNVHPKETEALEQYIAAHELTIKNIVLTHAHIDHVLGLQWAFDRFKVPVLLHENDFEILERNPMTARQFGFSFSPFSGDLQYINEGDQLQIDEDVLKIYHVPGHSPGSVAYHCEKQKFIISGDVLFQGSIGRTDLYKGNHEQLLQSIENKLFVLEDDTEVFSGHGYSTTIGFEKKFNPFFH